jgi:hypothetical protein
MRLWHLLFSVALVAFILVMIRDPVGCVAVIVFFTGLGEVFFGTTALLLLFQTVGSFGEAKGFLAHVEALVATAMVLFVATAVMSAWLFIGAWLVQASVS